MPTSSPSIITEEQVASDLARLPPSLPHLSKMKRETSASLSLALVLLHQQSSSLLRMHNKEGAGVDLKTVQEELAMIRSQLAQCQLQQGPDPETEEGFRMADTLDEGAEGQDLEDVDKEMYMRVLRRHKALPTSLRLQRPAVVNVSSSSSSSGGDGSQHQSMRDLERDQLALDGCLYKPGLGGYARVLQWLRGAMEARLQECGAAAAGGGPDLEQLLGGTAASTKLEAYAKEMLRRINRTNSAGVSYDRLSRAFGVEGVTNIVPDSGAAEPLAISLDVGAFPLPTTSTGGSQLKKQQQHRQPASPPLRSPQRPKAEQEQAGCDDWAWGLRARLRTATAYDVYDEPVENKWLAVRAEFRETLCLPVVVVGGLGAAVAAASAARVVSLGASIRLTERQS